jgi:DNA-binding transcriptional MerR regulator
MIVDKLLAGQLAARCGLSERALETYELQGVIRGIAKGSRRFYSASDCTRLQQILQLMRKRGLDLEAARSLTDGLRPESQLILDVSKA